MPWFITHLSTVAFLLLFVAVGASSALARHEMKRADQLEMQLKTANAEIDREHRNEVKVGEITNAYETRLIYYSNQLSAARMRKPVCIVSPDFTAGGSYDPAGKSKSLGSMGISSAFLDELIAKGGRYQEQLRALQQAAAAVCGK